MQEVKINQKVSAFVSSQSRSVWLIYICTFFYWMAMYLYVPVLPVYAESRGASLTMVGIIVAAYALPQLLFRIPLGIWSDYLGRQKPLILGGAAMVLLGSIGLGLAANPVLLALSRFLIGIGAAAWVVFPIFLVTFFTEDKIGQAVGMINFVTGLALVITSFLGGILAETRGERFVFFAAALIALAALSSLLLAKESVVMPKESFSLARFNQVTRRPLLIVVSIMAILVLFAYFSSVLGFMPVYAAKIGASDSGLGILTMMNMIGSMSGSLAAAPLVKRRGNVFTIVISALLLGLTLLAIPFIHNLPALGAVLLINGLGYGLLSTQLMVLSIFNISQQQRATAMGFYQSMYAIGMLSGPLVAGRLSERFGLPVVFYLGGALCLIVIGLAFLPVLPGRSKTAI